VASTADSPGQVAGTSDFESEIANAADPPGQMAGIADCTSEVADTATLKVMWLALLPV
jgi:hypothetical protein